MKNIVVLILLLSCFNISIAQEMDFKTIKLLIAKEATVVKENDNVVEYNFKGMPLILITDENANRMRIMAGVVEQSVLKEEDLVTLMEANFDRALDAKYALANGILWSVFAHPLKQLENDQLIDALYQVRNLVATYGTTYQSTNLQYGK
ncbi:MAG: hypothetical protein ABJF04_03320 [Reichenbachiella sp.]|uniref:hypothetical protein n=1 Tax=Reichenbachiella sp. TaxID=2184521 RepID=UPI003267E921